MHIGPPDMGLKLISGRMADQGEVEPGAGRVLHADPLLVRHPAVQAPAHLLWQKSSAQKVHSYKLNFLTVQVINNCASYL